MSSVKLSRKACLRISAAVLAVYLVHCVTLNYVVDDAYITFQYVKNFVHGQGLVYNPGERVEGYTNFLWTMLLSVFAWFAPEGTDILPVAQTLGIVFGAVTILLTFRFGRLTSGAFDGFSVIAPALLAANAAFAAWSTGGLETTLFTLLIVAASYFYLAAKDSGALSPAAPLLLALATLTRPDGALFYGVISLHLMLSEMWSGRSVLSRRVAGWFLCFAAVFVPYFLWRLYYYGYPLPNTFYAKVGGGAQQYLRGLRYVGEYLFNYGSVVLLIPMPFLWLYRSSAWLRVLSAQVGIYTAYVVYVGGDGLAFQRFMVPVAPFFCILAQESIRGGYHWARQTGVPAYTKMAAGAVCTLVLGVAALSARPSMGGILFPETHRWYEAHSELSFPGDGKTHKYLNFDNYFVERQRQAAEWLDAHAPAGSLVAATPAGSIAYYSRMPVIDMLGLNDVHIAHNGRTGYGWNRAGHEKGDGKYVLSRSPDFILLGNVAVLPRPLDGSDMAGKLIRTSEHEIWAEPEFHDRYELVTRQLHTEGVFRYFMFYKKKSVILQEDAAGTHTAHLRKNQ